MYDITQPPSFEEVEAADYTHTYPRTMTATRTVGATGVECSVTDVNVSIEVD